MIPPNGYTRATARQTMAYISEATGAREIAIAVDAGKGKSINPSARVVQDLAAECADGNGTAEAPIVDANGQHRTVSTRNSPIVRQLADASTAGIKKLLRWVSDKANSDQ